MPIMGEERNPQEERAHGGDEPHSDEARNGNSGPVPAVERLLPASHAAPWELARVAIGGPPPDEIVPTPEGVTFFKGEIAAQFEAAGDDESLLKARLDRGKRRRV